MRDSVVLNWSGTLAPAKVELTDVEILERYGSLMEGAVSAFRVDPSYIVQMAEVAASLKSKRQARLAKLAL